MPSKHFLFGFIAKALVISNILYHFLFYIGFCAFKHFLFLSFLYIGSFSKLLSVCAILCMLLCFQSSSNYRYSVYALVIKTFSIFLYSFVLSKFFYFCLFICLGSCCIIFSWLYHLFFT